MGAAPGRAVAETWTPPAARLPAPYDHVELLSRLGSSGNRCAWAATSQRHAGHLVVVLFLPKPPQLLGDTIDSGDGGNGRYLIDLDPRSGWLPFAIAAALPATLPKPFDGFELLSFVGLGPSGSVWMAESTSYPDTPLAVKFLDGYPELHSRKVRERFREEALASKRINSSFLVPTLDVLDLHEYGARGWAPVALVSWLQEPSLQRVLDDLKAAGQSLTDERASALVNGVSQGLRELHGAYELVHRDVKPSNILLRLPGDRPYRGPESLEGARALLADFTATCRAGQRPLLSGVKTGGASAPPSTASDPGDSLGPPATDEEDWRGFLGVVAAVAKVADERFQKKVGTLLPAGRGAKVAAEALRGRLFPEEAQEETVCPPDLLSAEDRGIWRQMRSGSDAPASWPDADLSGRGSAPPIEVPGYKVVELLGRGGMGAAFKAIDLRLHRTVAVKVLYPGYHSPHAVGRLHVEAEAIARLDHPHIVCVFEVGVLRDGLPYIAMELLAGGSLKDWPRSPHSPRECAELVRALARAVSVAHGKGVIHRDLKPANVLFAADGTPKIIDFGLAKFLDRDEGLTNSGQVMGTPAYMAPEQARGEVSSIGPGVDIYGLGGILYWLLTGKAPFDGHSQVGLLQSVLTREPRFPRALAPDVPRDLEAICLKCLEKKPTNRYASASDLSDDLERFLDSRPIRARPASALERAVKWSRRRPAGVALLAAGLCITGVTAAVLVRESSLLRRGRDAEKRTEDLGRLTDRAQVALDRGQFDQARSLFDRALTVAPPGQRSALEVRRLPCLFAYGHWDELQNELDRLGGRDDLPDDLRARVLLYRGDFALCDPAAGRRESGRDLIRRALDVPGGLASADAAYARGLLDESTFDAGRHFEEALEHAPFHLRANTALLMELVLSGQFEQSRQRAEFMSRAFPGEPVRPLALALVATLQEDAAALARHRAELLRIVADPSRMEVYDATFVALDDAIGADHLIHGPNKATPTQSFAPTTTALKQLSQGMNSFQGMGASNVVGLPQPVLNRPARMVEEMAQAYKMLVVGDAAGAAALLQAAEKKYPESLLRLIDATAHLNLARIRLSQDDLDGSFRESRRAHALAEEAADAPTLIPFGPYRHNARWLCVMIEVAWGAQYRSDSARLAVAAVAPGASNALGAAVTLAAGQERLQAYPVRKDRRHLLRVAAEGGAFDEARSYLLPRLLDYFEDDDARLLLKDWARAAPNDPQPFRLLAAFELARKNFGEALRWAELGLAEHPSDSELRGTRGRAIKALESAAPEGK